MNALKGISIRSLWLAGMWLSIMASAHAQTVNRPDIKVGDRWKYEQRDSLTNLVTGNKEWIVTSVGDTQIEATENDMPLVLSRDMNPIETPDARFEPTAAALKFPFSVGDKWSWKGKVHLKAAAMTISNEYEVQVEGQEKVTVSGRAFDTYKLVMRGYINANNNSRPFTRTYWYAPEARGYVKILNEDRRNPWTMELLDLALAQ